MFKRLSFLILASLLAFACGGGGGGGSGATPKSAPVISNLSYTPTAAYVNVSGGQANVTGSISFTGANGGVASLTIAVLDASGAATSSATAQVPKGAALTSGVLQGSVLATTTTAGTYTIKVTLTDQSGLVSNALTGTFRVSAFPWTPAAAMPTLRSGFAVASLNGLIYVCGGQLQNTGVTPGPATAVVEIFNPATGTWTSGPSMPTGLIGASAATLGGKLYVLGGDNTGNLGSTTVEQFDPGTSAWTTLPAMPTSRIYAAAAAVGSEILVAGGDNASTPLKSADAYGGTGWTSVASMPTARAFLAADAIGGSVYVVGGYASGGGGFLGVLEGFNPATGQWAALPPLPVAREHHAAVAVSGVLYVMAGDNANGSLTSVTAFSPSSGTWTTKTDLPAAPALNGAGVVGVNGPGVGAAVVNGIVYLFGASATFAYNPANDIL